MPMISVQSGLTKDLNHQILERHVGWELRYCKWMGCGEMGEKEVGGGWFTRLTSLGHS